MNRFGVRVALVTVGLVCVVSLVLGAILVSASIEMTARQIEQTGRGFALLLATELEQKGEMAGHFLSMLERSPGWRRALGARGPGGAPPSAATNDRREAPGERPPDAPPPSSDTNLSPREAARARAGEEFRNQFKTDLLEVANVIHAVRIAIVTDAGVSVSVAPPGGSVDPLTDTAAVELWKRLQQSSNDDTEAEVVGSRVVVMTKFNGPPNQGKQGLLIEFPVEIPRRLLITRALASAGATLAVLVVAIFAGIALSRSVSKPLAHLAQVAHSYGEGDWGVRAAESGPVETAILGRAFNNMSDALQEHIRILKDETTRREQLESELRIAARLQHSLLPAPGTRDLGPIDIIGSTEAAKEVGGDFYDYWRMGTGRIGILVGDATGKGLTAALLAGKAVSAIQALAETVTDPAELLRRANAVLVRQFNNDGHFVTALLVVIDLESSKLLYALAGHNPGFVFRAGDGSIAVLESRSGLPLGVRADTAFETHCIDIEPGDTVLLYTDGVTEAFSSNETLYGQQRLLDSCAAARRLPLESLLDALETDLMRHRNGRVCSDDSTIVLARAGALADNPARVAQAEMV